MFAFPYFQAVIGLWVLVSSSLLLGQDGGPSLEDLEKMGSELDQKPPPPSNVAAPATDTGLPSQPVAPAEAPSYLDDMADAKPIDVRSQLKKTLEPNIFAGAPPIPGTLRNMAMGEAPEEYEVKEGDNLFDICDQLLDEGDYWPKLWSFNPTIANPHFVYPGMKLRFYAGDSENPPYLRVVTEDDIVPVNKDGIVESELVREDISGMLMRSEVPENMQVIGVDELERVPGIDEMFIFAGNTKVPSQAIRVIVPAFIVPEEFPVFGLIVGGSAGSFLLSTGSEAIIEEEDEGMKVGSTYSVVRETSKIYTPLGSNFVGYRYEYIGQLQVKSQKEDIFKAEVTSSRLGVQPGDLVIPFRSVKRSMPEMTSDLIKGRGQQVVGFHEPMMLIGGRGSMAFIDQTEGKLQVGASYQLMQNIQVSAPMFLRDQLPETDRKVARVYILDNSGSAALAYISSDAFEVRLGDRLEP